MESFNTSIKNVYGSVIDTNIQVNKKYRIYCRSDDGLKSTPILFFSLTLNYVSLNMILISFEKISNFKSVKEFKTVIVFYANIN